MQRTTWDRINELFEAARALPAEQREAWVRGATADAHIQSEVLSLLHAHEDDPWFVDEPGGRRTPSRITPGHVTPAGGWPGKPTPAPAATPSDLRAPSGPARRRAPEAKAGGQFADYRLVREIASDPARVIFEAVATGGGQHPRVSLHVFAADTRGAVFPALLHAEGNILARLDHPGIPRLLDGGVTEDGTAYLAFEYAAGDPIDAWCRERQPAVRERVSLVLAGCSAVQHAHEHLVAHGDLRPANVLVSADKKVKLLDCGMWAVLGFVPATGGTSAPVHASMSPEQARGEVLTTASDVYALGVLLYTLVTGYPPYEIAGQAPARARQMICEVEPDVPSTIVGARDRRVLAGTLDRIILTALRKNPRERYATAAAFAADLRAWRDGHPASVAPATFWSRTIGAGGRRALRLGRAALVVGLLAGTGVLGWQYLIMRGERDQARTSLAAAERTHRAAAEAIAARRPAVADLRLQVAAMTSDLALAARRSGDLAKAEALWTQALSDVRPVLDASPDDVRALDQVAAVQAFLGSLRRSQRRFQEALALYRDELRLREREAGLKGAPPSAAVSLAAAQTSVARLLLDLVEVRPPGPADAARLREAGALLAQAGPAVQNAALASPGQQGARAELDRQAGRLRRLSLLRR